MSTAVQDVIAGLVSAIATPPERNDLGRLASMHSSGQQLVETVTAAGGAAAGALRTLAENLITLLEKLILDEAAQPDVGIGLISELVNGLAQLEQGATIGVEELVQKVQAAIGGAPAPTPVAAPPVVTAVAAPVPPPTSVPPPALIQPPPVAGPAPVAAPPRPVAAPAPAPAPEAECPPPAAEEEYVSEPLVLDLSEREHLDGFLDEAAEHMDAIEAGLLALESDANDPDKINELFRPFHTIKGIAGFLNLRDINRLTHEIETILDLGRKGEMRIGAALVDMIFASVDVLKAQLAAIRTYLAAPTGGPCPQPPVADSIMRLRRAVQNRGAEAVDAEPAPRTATAAANACEVESPATAGESERTAGPAGPAAALDHSIRVDTRKLDLLVDAVGELVIAQSMVSLTEAVTGDEKLHRNVAQVTKIVRDVQETAMAMRMVPIGHTFQKMRRLVRDVAKKAGKQVDLTIAGEETELDKNVIQQISDPLVHMVRNAVDHGVESPAERRAAGKPEAGQVLLNAFHQGDSIVIEIRDDGRGLDRDKLIAKARERGLIDPDEALTDSQANALVFAAGLSTAEKITDISGRGVGMDVVKRNVEQLRGKIEIQSEKGRGSTFLIRLPLTLAIIDGMLVRVGRERMIIPTILIEQSLQPEPHQITTVQNRGAMLQVRGELCPLIQLNPLFGYGGPVDPCENLVVIVQCEGQKIALVLDELIGQQQVVIKTLGDRFKKVSGVSGAAILGDGRVGLIVEPTGLLTLHKQRGVETYRRGDLPAAVAALVSERTIDAELASPNVELQPLAEPVTVPA
jgi:two-component system, chemotaxis family, sensor kinase CheA